MHGNKVPPPEAMILINGNVLNVGQSMALRVAVEVFIGDLVDTGLGEDETGKKISAAYIERLQEVRALMGAWDGPEIDESLSLEEVELLNMGYRAGYSPVRIIPGIGLCGLSNFMHTTGLSVGIGPVVRRGRYCYEHFGDALEALNTWDGAGDPPGPWRKYKGIDGERLGPGAVGEFA